MKSNTASYAERELDILVKTVKDPIIKPFIPEIIALCDKFGKSGQSGGSAPFTAAALSQAIKKLCLQEPICEITGIEEEWMDVSDISDGEILFQNNRCSSVFKVGNNQSYYLDAISFKSEKNICYFSNNVIMPDGTKLRSKQYIKKFPFKPKTFYIDIIEEEVAKDDWEFYIKDEKQLKAVWKYYNRFD